MNGRRTGARLARLIALVGLLGVLATLAPLARAEESAPAPPPKAKPAETPLVWGDFYPANPNDLFITQPDGTKFKARLTNAEIGGELEIDGYTVTRRSDGWFVFATGRDDEGALVEAAARAGLDAVPAGIERGAGRTPNIWDDGRGGDIRAQALRQLQIAAAQSQKAATTTGEPRLFKFPVLMLATWWDEEAGQTAPQFQEGNTAAKFKELLSGFGGNPRGTLTEYYFENSYGQFVVQVDVYGPYVSQRSQEDRCYYGNIEATGDPFDDLDPIDNATAGGGGAIGMAAEAVPQADPDVDFSQYDNDGDGLVDFTALLHSGPDMAATGDPCHTWSHAAAIPGGIPTTDGPTVSRVFTMPEIDLEIGVAAHEMAHALGEPDYYNPNYTSMGTGDWDMMAGGSWFGNPPGSNPTGFNPTTKVFQGWLTPTIVHEDMEDVSLQPRELLPADGYTGDQVNPNILLVPTAWAKVGEVDQYEHEWTEDDVYGLVEDGENGFVVEGFYVENWSRTVNAESIHPEMSRAPYFDRQALSSGIMAWHFDYFYRSNVYFGTNNAGGDPNRPQMDPMEFDRNDNTQELQLSLTRGEPSDLIWGAATGITSGTHRKPPGLQDPPGDPQEEITGNVVVPPGSEADFPFTVEEEPDNAAMSVSAAGTLDCTLQLYRVVDGEEQQASGVQDGGLPTDVETIEIIQPEAGDWIARVRDFAACGAADVTVTFENSDAYNTRGAASTWSNWTEAPTGWAFTNVGPAQVEDIDHAADAPGPEAISLDVVNLDDTEADASPGFVTAEENEVDGHQPINAGQANPMSVPVVNNGGAPVASAHVTVHTGSADGPVVTEGDVGPIDPYNREMFDFEWQPGVEGPADLFVTVEADGDAHPANDTQKTTLWAGPEDPAVLIVDDDGSTDSEVLYAGALASLGIPYAVADDHVTAETLSQYEAVVWEAGLERYQGQMNADDRAAIATYLDGGGKVLLTSPRAAAALGELPNRTNPTATADMAPFLAQYFGATYVDTLQVGGGRVTGAGDILGDAVFETDVFPGRPLQDVWTVAEYGGEGQPTAIGTPTEVASWEKGGEGALMGVRVDGDEAHGEFRSVFLGFNLAQLLRTDDAVEILADVMEHFDVAGDRYTVDAAEPIVYHPQVRNRVSGVDTPIKVIALGDDAAPVTLSYRHHGAGEYETVDLSAGGHPGAFQGTIPGTEVTPDGVDYFLKAGEASTYDPRLAADGAVVHAIGVALPEAAANPDSCPPGLVPDPGLEDIAESVHLEAITCVAWYTITLGVGDRDGDGDNEYAPDEGVTRGQMASFLTRLAVEAGVPLPADAPNAFPDDDTSPHAANIDAVAALGIASGREGQFFPDEKVSRAQMASFIARLYELVTEELPEGSPDAFGDDDGSTHEESINAMADLDIVRGRADTDDYDGDGNTAELVYGPGDDVSRAQMASFIIRTLEHFVDLEHAFTGGAEVDLDAAQYGAGDEVTGVLHTTKTVQSVTVSGCGLEETAVEPSAEDGTFAVTLPADAPAGDCELAFTVVTLRPGAEEGAPTQSVTDVELIGVS